MSHRLLGQRWLIRRRYIAARDADGKWARTLTEERDFQGSLQDLGGQSRGVDRDGRRQSDTRQVIVVPDFLRTEDQHNQVEADEVVDCITGEVYKVVGVARDGGLLPHMTATLMKLQEVA